MGWQPETQPKGKPPVEKTEGAETMQRLIDADALKESVHAHDYVLKDCLNSTDKGMFTVGIMQAIDEQPTIDAVSVIRCKDCKYVGTDATCCLVCNREGIGLRPFHVYHDDYCSYAERKVTE